MKGQKDQAFAKMLAHSGGIIFYVRGYMRGYMRGYTRCLVLLYRALSQDDEDDDAQHHFVSSVQIPTKTYKYKKNKVK
jgi:hypothetical protein